MRNTLFLSTLVYLLLGTSSVIFGMKQGAIIAFYDTNTNKWSYGYSTKGIIQRNIDFPSMTTNKNYDGLVYNNKQQQLTDSTNNNEPLYPSKKLSQKQIGFLEDVLEKVESNKLQQIESYIFIPGSEFYNGLFQIKEVGKLKETIKKSSSISSQSSSISSTSSTEEESQEPQISLDDLFEKQQEEEEEEEEYEKEEETKNTFPLEQLDIDTAIYIDDATQKLLKNAQDLGEYEITSLPTNKIDPNATQVSLQQVSLPDDLNCVQCLLTATDKSSYTKFFPLKHLKTTNNILNKNQYVDMTFTDSSNKQHVLCITKINKVQEIEEITNSEYILNDNPNNASIMPGYMVIEDKDNNILIVTADQKLYRLQSDQDCITEITKHIGKNHTDAQDITDKTHYVLFEFTDKDDEQHAVQVRQIKEAVEKIDLIQKNPVQRNAWYAAAMKFKQTAMQFKQKHPGKFWIGGTAAASIAALIGAYLTGKLDIITSWTQPGIDMLTRLLQQATDLMRKKSIV